jgi:ATP-dependent RNA helicase DDX31/DBP7
VLVSTDVAARGLDFPSVTHILQYDPPGETSDYVQRVGRTARMGRRGIAILFLAPSELLYKDQLEADGVPITQQKLYPLLATLPKPLALSKSARAEADQNRQAFQVAMDSAHLCQVHAWTTCLAIPRCTEARNTAGGVA